MRIKLLIPLLAVLTTACTPKSNVIYYPDIESSNTTTVEVYGIEKTDTATILHTEVYYRPQNKLAISSDTYLTGNTTGNTYKLLGSPDFELDTDVTIPESGKLPATLVFEPVGKEEKAISLIDGYGEGGFRIEGISLLPPKKKKYTCLIEGEIIDYPQASRLILAPYDTDIRVNRFISIPIRDGKFRYEFTFDDIEKYSLVFWNEYIDGSWYTNEFIAEPETIHFRLYDRHKNDDKKQETDTKGELNNEYTRFKKEFDSMFSLQPLYDESNALREADGYYTKEYMDVLDELRALPNEENPQRLYSKLRDLKDSGEAYTDEAKAIEDKIKQKYVERQEYTLEYAKKNTSLTGYTLLMEIIRELDYMPDAEVQSASFTAFEAIYRDKYPDHPYTENINNIITSEKIVLGGKYIDFTAPDLNGNQVKLSEQIEGKVALIDLWASWCGPCRRTSISMIPLYEAYKDKGFTIVGVAREKNNTKAMEKAIEKDGYLWLNLVELNDAGKIWEQYGAGNGGGMTVLVDRDGTILAIRTNAEEVQKFLEAKCK